MKHKGLMASVLLFSFLLLGCSDKEAQAKDFSPDDITEINVSSQSYNLTLRSSTDEKIHVKSTKNIKGLASLQDTTLSIKQAGTKSGIFKNFSFGSDGEIIIYIPKQYTGTLSISNDSGNLSMDSLTLKSLTLSNKSGYQELNSISTDSANFFSGTGDLKIKASSINNLEIVSTSGYITLNKVATDKTEVKSKSGEINISDNTENASSSLSSTSGDITISYKKAPNDMNFDIGTNSDDITMKLSGKKYEIDTLASKKGCIGDGQNLLSVSSDSGTIIIQ